MKNGQNRMRTFDGRSWMNTPKPMSCRHFAKLWDCDCDWARIPGKKYSIHVFEWLDTGETVIPKDARPSCCYTNQIDFWSNDGNTKLLTIHHHDFYCTPNLLLIEGVWYETGMGHVEYVRGRWCLVRECWRNGRLAKMLNRGFPEYRK